MKFSKLYSNKKFKNIIFNTQSGGLNVILADVKFHKSDADTHNLGKSTLIEVLDFMLLKDIKAEHFFKKIKNLQTGDPLFKGYEFYLEILLNNGQYLTIHRAIDKPTRINFKHHNKPSEGFIHYTAWDKDDISLDKAQTYLNNCLKLDFCERTSYDYRKLLNYSLRKQGDYKDLFQLEKFSRGKDRDWKPFMFELLGFNGSLLVMKYDLEEQIKQIKTYIKEQEKDSDVRSGEKDKIVGQIQNKDEEKRVLERQLEKLDFNKQDQRIISDLTERIENQISDYNKQLYQIEFDIQKLESSISERFSFDISRVESLFGEVEVFFPDKLKKTYNDLLEFNRKITEERNSQIQTTLIQKKSERQVIINKLRNLSEEKEQYAKLILDTSIFKKYKEYQRELAKIQEDLVRLESKLDTFDTIEKRNKQIDELKEELKKVVTEIDGELGNTISNKQYNSIRKIFRDLVLKILNAQAVLSIYKNTNDNIEFKYDIENTAQKEGFTYGKLLCVAFDMAVIIYYSTQSYIKFIYHDDVFGSEDNRLKIRLLSVIREFCEKYDLQYIFTAIRHDFPKNEPLFEFKDSEKILELHDGNEDGKLFYMTF